MCKNPIKKCSSSSFLLIKELIVGFVKFLKKVKIGKTGQTFILEPSGFIIASSTEEEPFLRNADGTIKERLQAN